MSIRSRLLLIALLAAVLPALLMLARFMQDRNAAVAADTDRLARLAHHAAETLADRVRGTAQLHYGLAHARDLFTDDRAACSAFLAEVRAAHPQYTGILTATPDGRLFCDSLRSGRELDLRDRGYFKAALAATDRVVLEPVFGRLTGIAVLQIAYPVRTPQGALQFMLLASLNLPQFVAGTEQQVTGAQLLLVDHKGMVLAVSGGAARSFAPGSSIAGTPLFHFASTSPGAATIELPGAAGDSGRWAVADSALTHEAQLYVLAGAPESALLAGTQRLFAQNMALLGGAALLLFLAVWLLAELGLRRPIARIAGMARQLAEGDLSARIVPPLPRGELGELMQQLNDTAQALQRQTDDIRQLHASLQQSQRLQAVGQLTGGIAHDFNNLLTVVMGNAELLAEQLQGDPQQQRLAQMVGRAAMRGAELTKHLLAFARKQALDPKPVDVNPLVAALDPMLRRTLGEHIDIELIRAAGLWQALVDPGQLENAVLNLCLNARDAMPRGGRLTLETANSRLDHDYADRHAEVTAGQYVMLAVSDTGQGIAPPYLQKVFEPFFTTKEKGKGTGLGLAMVYGFTKQSGGHVSIYSELGQGTTVKLYLPRAPHSPPAAPLPPPADAAAVGGTDLVLLVEDDDAVRQFAAEQLRTLGYRVLVAEGGTAALALLEQHADIALLFTDVVMPGGMSGRELADAACQRRPGLRVLYTSGYTENAIVHHGRLDPGVMLLSKPYKRADLARAIRVALSQPRTPG